MKRVAGLVLERWSGAQHAGTLANDHMKVDLTTTFSESVVWRVPKSDPPFPPRPYSNKRLPRCYCGRTSRSGIVGGWEEHRDRGNLLLAVALGTGAYLRLASRPSNGSTANVSLVIFSSRPLSPSLDCLDDSRSGQSSSAMLLNFMSDTY